MGAGLGRVWGGSEEVATAAPSAVSGALSSLWNTSSDKDETCVHWGLVNAVNAVNNDHALFHVQSKKERIVGFFSCLCLGLICFGLVCIGLF